MHHLKFTCAIVAAAFCAGLSGCTMCCAPYDCDYLYQGGRWVRDNPSCGRVGSAFEPAGYKVDEGEVIGAQATEPTPAEAGQMLDPNIYDDAAPAPAPRPQMDMTSTPRLRRVDRYLPQE